MKATRQVGFKPGFSIAGMTTHPPIDEEQYPYEVGGEENEEVLENNCQASPEFESE